MRSAHCHDRANGLTHEILDPSGNRVSAATCESHAREMLKRYDPGHSIREIRPDIDPRPDVGYTDTAFRFPR
jgi:hypothetical protein